jgi:hypothetical protein
MPLNRPSVLTSTLVLLAAAGSTAGASPAPIPIRDFTDIVSSLKSSGSSLQFCDYNLDGRVTDFDILAASLDALRSWTPNDLDGDGAITALDSDRFLKLYIGTTHGDADGDMRIGNGDFVAVVPEVFSDTPHIIRGDVNADLRVDGRDLYAIATIVATEFETDWLNTNDVFLRQATTIIRRLEQVGVEAVDKFIRGEYVVLHDDNHIKIVSEYPAHVVPTSNGHLLEHSGAWPSNHDHAASWGWYRPYRRIVPGTPTPTEAPEHDKAVSRRDWPSNHYRERSDTWYHIPGHNSAVSKEYAQPSPPSHVPQTSSITMPEPHKASHSSIDYHRQAYSASWINHPGHVSTYSHTWPNIGPLTHKKHVSATWPPSHSFVLSSDPSGKREHLKHVSDTYSLPGQLGHSTAWSDLSPLNHEKNLSLDRGFPHNTFSSSLYPANHSKIVSDTWPARSIMPWPPNHLRKVSDSWSEPATPLRFFPENHEIVPSAKDVKDLIPKIPALPLP